MVDYPDNEEYPEEEEEEEITEVKQQVISIPIHRLRVHPLSKTIYRERRNSKEIKLMAENMRLEGQLVPIFINSQDVILSGVRRYYAALRLGHKALNAIISDIPDKDKEVEVIVSHNKQRVKKPWQFINEVEAILGTLGQNQGRRNDLLKSDKSNPYGKIGKNRFEVAASILDGDLSGTTLRRLISVSDFEKESQENKNLGLIDKIFKNELSPFKASNLVKGFKKQKEEREEAKTRLAKRKSIKLEKQPYKIFHKSCESMDEVESGSVQIVFTSPPYFGLRNYGVGSKGKPELGHERTYQEFIRNLSRIFREVRRVVNDKGSFFLNIGDTYKAGENLLIPPRLLLNLCDNEGWYFVNEIIWKKSNTIPQTGKKRLQPIYEKILHLVKDPNNYFYQEFKNWKESDEIKLIKKPTKRDTSSVEAVREGYMLSKTYEKFKDFIDEQKVKNIISGSNASIRQKELKKLDYTKDHPALMPPYLPVIPILTTSKEGDIVLDPFSGSGSTGNAALFLGRRYIGYELNKDNFELSIMDLSNTIEKMNDGQPSFEEPIPEDNSFYKKIGNKRVKLTPRDVKRPGIIAKNGQS